MNYGRTIKIFLPSGQTDEVKIASIANSTVQATLIPRNVLPEIEKYDEIASTGIYFLLDNDFNVYVGEAEIVTARINQHNKDERKDWWNLVITINVNSINSPLSKGDIKFLEGFCYNKIIRADRFKLDQTNPAKASVSRDREADLMHIFEDIKILVSTLGYSLFNPKRKQLVDEIEEVETKIFYMKSKNGDATGEYTSEGFIIYKDSKLQKFPPKNWKDRKYKGKPDKGFFKLMDDIDALTTPDKADEFDDYYVLKEDLLCNSVSRAASIVSHNAYNGWYSWKDKSGKTLDELYRPDKDNKK